MKTSAAILSLFLTVPALSAVLPRSTVDPPYIVPDLSARKDQITAAGGDALSLAQGMLEVENLDAKSYPYGDGNTYNDSKNFGIYKMSWALIRNCSSQFAGQTMDQVDNAKALDSDIAAATRAHLDCRGVFGDPNFLAVNRCGFSALSNPTIAGVTGYQAGVGAIQSYITSQPQYQTNNYRVATYVQPLNENPSLCPQGTS